MKDSGLFPDFKGWSAGYGVFTYSRHERSKIINYVRNQQVHHRKEDYRTEIRKILDEFGVGYDEQYLP